MITRACDNKNDVWWTQLYEQVIGDVLIFGGDLMFFCRMSFDANQ